MLKYLKWSVYCLFILLADPKFGKYIVNLRNLLLNNLLVCEFYNFNLIFLVKFMDLKIFISCRHQFLAYNSSLTLWLTIFQKNAWKFRAIFRLGIVDNYSHESYFLSKSRDCKIWFRHQFLIPNLLFYLLIFKKPFKISRNFF